MGVKFSAGPIRAGFLGALLLAGQACSHPPPVTPIVARPVAPTAEDVRVGRQAMPISEVSFMLSGGTSQTGIIADVNRRHVPERISAALELELANRGARPTLIAALKNERNILTENQKQAFAQSQSDRTSRPQRRAQTQPDPAVARLQLEENERQRVRALTQENYRNIERRLQEKANRESAQAHRNW